MFLRHASGTNDNEFQTIDVILAWLIAEDDGAKKKVVALLADRDEDLSLVRGTLQGMLMALYSEESILVWY